MTVPIVAQTERTRQIVSRRVAVLIERLREETKRMNTITYVLIGIVVVLVYWIVLDTKDIKRIRKRMKELEREISEKEE